MIELVVGFDDAVQASHVAKVHEQGRLGESELDQRDEAVAAGQQLCLAFPILEDLQRLVQVARTDVVELSWNHRALTLLPRMRGDVWPVRPGDGRRTAGDDTGASIRRFLWHRPGSGAGNVARQYRSGVVPASTRICCRDLRSIGAAGVR